MYLENCTETGEERRVSQGFIEKSKMRVGAGEVRGKTRENADNHVAIGYSLSSDWSGG